MTTGASIQSGRNFNWPLAASVVAHATVVALGLTLALAFQQRLPEASAVPVRTWAACQVILVGLLAAYIWRTSRSHREGPDQVAERVLPNALMAAGAVLSMMLSAIVDNLDAPTARQPSPLGLVVIFSGVYLSSILGRRLGSAASARRFRLGRPARRVSWMAAVGADRTWRLRFGLVYGATLIVLLVWVTASQGFPLFLALWIAAIWWVAVGMGPAAVVFITETGVRVAGRSLEAAPSWAVPVGDIASVGVVHAVPGLELALAWNARRCVLRSGPALEIGTWEGRSYVVSLPSATEAAEAAAVLHGLMGRRLPHDGGSVLGVRGVD